MVMASMRSMSATTAVSRFDRLDSLVDTGPRNALSRMWQILIHPVGGTSNATLPGCTGGRIWPSLAAADLDGESQFEILPVNQNGWAAVYTPQGRFKPGWPAQVAAPYEGR